MTEAQLDEMGPVDYVVLEWADDTPGSGEVQPLLLELVDRGIIRILDIAFVAKGQDGSVSAIEVDGGLHQLAAAFAELAGASSGLLGEDDLQEAAAALIPVPRRPCSSGRTAGPPRSPGRCGPLVASGRIPVQAILASLDAVEAGN